MKVKMICGLESIPKNKKNLIVIVDAFRSSAVVSNCINNGGRIFLFNNKEDILEKKQIYDNILLGGEERALKIKGFDLGNSPQDYTKNKVENKIILYCSGFGSKAMLKAKADFVFLAGLTNAQAIINLLNKKFLNSEIYFVISGNKTTLCMDDLITAGVIIFFLKCSDLDNTSLFALNLASQYNKELVDLIYASPSVKNLLKLGFSKDVHFCITKSFNIVPYKVGIELLNYGSKKYRY